MLEAVPAIVLGLVASRALTDHPADARWLEPAEREWLADTLREELAAAPGAAVSLRSMLAHPFVWALAVVWLLTLTASYGIQFWLPQVLRDRSGSSDLGIGLLTAVPGLVAVAATVSVAAHSDATGERCLHTALPIVIGSVGLAAAAISHSLPVTLLGLSLAVAGIASAHGPFWSMAPRCLGGATVAAAGIAFIDSVASVGGFVGPYLMGAIKDRTQGYAAALLVLAALMLAAGTGAALLRQRQPASPP